MGLLGGAFLAGAFFVATFFAAGGLAAVSLSAPLFLGSAAAVFFCRLGTNAVVLPPTVMNWMGSPPTLPATLPHLW